MNTPLRVLRAQQNGGYPLAAECAAQDPVRRHIMQTACAAMARNGRHNIDFNTLAALAELTTRAFRHFFADLDELLGAILAAHLTNILNAVEAVPASAPNQAEARSAAYLAIARTPDGGLTEAHRLLVWDRHLLPPDVREPLERCRHRIGVALAGNAYQPVMAVLDMPELSPSMIRQCLAMLQAPTAGQAATPPQLAARAAPVRPAISPPPRGRPPAEYNPAIRLPHRAASASGENASLLARAGLGHIVAATSPPRQPGPITGSAPPRARAPLFASAAAAAG